uniref:soluble epoxide hydrolase n=1 Tax=Kalanchoe fedtschenkoi TaxID=63787 RepID=A0A7N0TN74_KALFE
MDSIKHSTLHLNGIDIHLAEKGSGPDVILFVHGFPELWYSWRHQILTLSDLGYRCLAPDMRGYGDTDAPEGFRNYTVFHVVGDLVALLDAVAPAQKVFVVGHDWGASVAWHLCLFRPDKVRALVNLSVPFSPRNPVGKPVDRMRHVYGDDYYMCRIQEPGHVEAEFAEFGAKRVLKELFGYKTPRPLFLPKDKCFSSPPDADIDLPPWMTEEDINYYASKFEKKGFTGGFNYYRVMNLNWELTAPWTGCQVKVPTKFITGDLDLVYNSFGAKNYVHSDTFKKAVPFLEEVVVLEGVAHWIQQEKPDEISKHIADFISEF